MSVITIHEAKTNLSKLIQRALAGEEIIIARRDQPLVKLTVIDQAKPVRRFGGLEGLIIAMGDDFDKPMDEYGNFPSEIPEKIHDPLFLKD